MGYWKKLVAEIDRSKFDVIAMTGESDLVEILDYVGTYDMGNWTILTIDKQDAENAGFSATPITAVINDDGRLEKVWVGLWENKVSTSAGEYFSVDFSHTGSSIN